MVRTLDPSIDDAIAVATLRLLSDSGFARLTVEGVARAAGVGKPAIYRRFGDKTALVAHVISSQLPALEGLNRVPRAKANGAHIVIVNGQPTEMDAYAHELLVGEIGEILPALVA